MCYFFNNFYEEYMIKNIFATAWGIIVTGAIIGGLAIFLQYLGNPGNMGVCVVCFNRDVAGAIGLHTAAVVQYLRPEIMGMVLGSFIAAIAFKEFKPRGGSAPFIRFALGFMTALTALVFLGCPWRTILRLAGGDFNAIVGFVGIFVGVGIGTLFFRNGFSLGRSHVQAKTSGFLFPLLMLALLALIHFYPLMAGEAKSGILNYSLKGPGAMHAPILIALGVGLLIGFIAQRSRFCSMGALRDLILFRQTHLLWGLLAMLLVAFAVNMALGSFHAGFEKQPIAHSDGLWNFLSMLVVGLASALAGGCPGRQLFMSGEGDNDAAIYVMGMLVGAAMAHNFAIAASPAGINTNSAFATVACLVLCLGIGFFQSKRGS